MTENRQGHGVLRGRAPYAWFAAFLVLLAVFPGCSSGSEDEDAAATVCDRSVSEVQDLVSGVVLGVPGFAGCAPDPDHPGGYVINVTSPGVDSEAVRAAILTYAGPSEILESATLRIVQLDVTDIQDWYMQAHNGLLTDLPDERQLEWGYWSAGIDLAHNQGLFWYANEDARVWAQSYILEEVDAPPGAIVAIFSPEPQDD